MENLILILVLISAIAVLVDAKKIGIQKTTLPGFWSISAWGWFVATLFLWIIAFPAYLYKRADYIKAVGKELKPIPFMVFGIITILLVCFFSYGKIVLDNAAQRQISSQEE